MTDLFLREGKGRTLRRVLDSNWRRALFGSVLTVTWYECRVWLTVIGGSQAAPVLQNEAFDNMPRRSAVEEIELTMVDTEC